MTPETELLPCPLCEGTVTHRTDKGFHYGDHGYREKIEEFRCQCGFRFSRIGDDITKEQAIEKYNTRPAPKAIDVEALKREIWQIDPMRHKNTEAYKIAIEDRRKVLAHIDTLNSRVLFGQVDQTPMATDAEAQKALNWIKGHFGGISAQVASKSDVERFNALKTIRSALSRMAPQWQDISTAPRDRWIFLWVPGHGAVRAHWAKRFTGDEYGWVTHDRGTRPTKMTHWREYFEEPVIKDRLTTHTAPPADREG